MITVSVLDDKSNLSRILCIEGHWEYRLLLLIVHALLLKLIVNIEILVKQLSLTLVFVIVERSTTPKVCPSLL